MKNKAGELSGGAGQPAGDDEDGGGEDEQNELKDVILKKLMHEMNTLGAFFEEVDGNKKLRPSQFLNAEIEDSIGKMKDMKDEIQGGYSMAMVECQKTILVPKFAWLEVQKFTVR